MDGSTPRAHDRSPELRRRALTLRHRDPEAAAALARQAVERAASDVERSWARLAVATVLNLLPRELGAASDLLGELLQEQPADARLYCAALHQLGENLALAGVPGAAIQRLEEALSLATRLEWHAAEARILSRLGSCLTTLGEFRSGLAHLLRALRFHDGEGGVDPRHLDDLLAWELGTLYGRIGIVYSNLDQGEPAIAHYEAALHCFADRYPLRAGRTLYRMGIAAEEHLGDLAAAEDYYRRSSELLGTHGTPAGRALGLGGLGRVALERREYARAGEALAEALAGLEGDAVHRPYLADVVRNLGEVQLGLGQPRAALPYFERALRLFTEDQRPAAHLAALHRTFYEAYRDLGEHEPALRHHETFHRLQMRHSQEQTDWRLAEMMVQFDTERALRQQELSRLRNEELEREVAERREAEAALARAKAELEELNRELHALTIRDPLTGVFNRRHLDVRLSEAFSLARRQRQELSVMICDLDDFKGVNDVHSHAVGDEVLRQVAAIIQRNVRQSDIVARFGGEEFVIVFPATSLSEAGAACEKLRALVAGHDWEAVVPGLRVTLSAGVAAAEGQPDHERLLADADRRLYQAKREGKNRVAALDC